LDGEANLSRGLDPCRKRVRQPIDGVASALLARFRGRRHIKRNTEIAILRADFLQRGDTRKTGLIGEVPIGGDNPFDVPVGEKTLRALARDFVDGVAMLPLARNRLRIVCPRTGNSMVPAKYPWVLQPRSIKDCVRRTP
jgi:hypothetical protein